MSIYEVSAALSARGVKHIVVDCSGEATALQIKFKSSAERAKNRREAKKYRLQNKSKLKMKRKKYAMKMKHKKPDRTRSQRAKLISKYYKHRS